MTLSESWWDNTPCQANPMLFATRLRREETNEYVARLTEAAAACESCLNKHGCRKLASRLKWTGVSGGVLFVEGKERPFPKPERADRRMEYRECDCGEYFRTLKTSQQELCRDCRQSIGNKQAYAELKTAKEVGSSDAANAGSTVGGVAGITGAGQGPLGVGNAPSGVQELHPVVPGVPQLGIVA